MAGRAAVVLLMAAMTLATACRERDPLHDRANELPLGHIDMPVDHAETGFQAAVAGWALDDKGVKEVRVFIDGRFAESTALNTQRPDVSKVFPQYANGNHLHGWSTFIVFEAPGIHTILAQAVDTNGATRDIGTVSVTSLDK